MLSKYSKSRNVRDFLLTASGNLSILFFGATGGILAARLLGPEGRGELAAAIVWAAIMGIIISVGLPQALTYYSAREPEALGDIFSTTMVILVVQSIIIILAGWILITRLFAHIQPDATSSLLVYIFSIPFSLLISYISTMCQGLKNFKLFNTLRVTNAAGYALSLTVIGLLGLNEAIYVVSALVMTQMTISISALIYFIKKFRPRGNCRLGRAKQLLGYGVKSYWGNLSWIANGRMDQFVMSTFIGLEQLGQYAVAVSYATVLFPLSSSFAMILFPHVASSDSQAALGKI